MVRNLADRLSSFFGRASMPPEDDQSLREFCEVCSIALVDATLYREWRVCPSCRLHYPLTARERISLVTDPGTFRESQRSIVSLDVSDSRSASSHQASARETRRTGLTEATVTGRGAIGGRRVILIALDFRFLGGSLGAVVGEKVSRALDLAVRRKLPVVAFVTSGSARMQEGVLSLMQMAKTTLAVNALDRERLPFITVMANPTTGQVYSSFATLADIILAEPGALLGLAPSRVQEPEFPSSNTPDIHLTEAYLAHGMIDRVVDREHQKELLSVLLELLTPEKPLPTSDESEEETSSKVDKSIEDRIGDERIEELWPPEWGAVPLARHNERPSSLDFIRRSLSTFVELHGDRLYGDDSSIVSGLGRLGTQAVMVIGQEKGHDVTSKERNEGRPSPEGFRKAQRMMKLASKLHLPLITFVDTPGPNYGWESEERGLGNAIASTMSSMAQLPVPTISVVVGEGGSEGALALGVADRILMLENAFYSVTSPENAASLLFHRYQRTREIMKPLRLTAQDCQELGIIDRIVTEPPAGAHGNPDESAQTLKSVLEEELATLKSLSTRRLLRHRRRKFRKMGEYSSHFRLAVAQERSHLQGYMAQGVRLIRRRRRKKGLPQVEQEDKEE